VDAVASTASGSGDQDAAELLIASVGEYWSRITAHPFVAAVASGPIDSQVFSRWVAADYLFSVDFLKFNAGLLAIAPDLPACRVLGRHLQRTQETLDLLIDTAESARVDLAGEPGPFTLGLTSYLRALLAHGYEVSLSALYCVERVYFDAWSAVAPRSNRSAPYRPLVEHLSSEEFKVALGNIGGLLDDVAPDGPTAGMTEAVEMCVRFELLFWSEIYVGGSW
jgi:thiaminase/transcriptional activator TenA